MFFISLLTALVAENSHILVGSYFIFLKNVLDQTRHTFNTKFGLQSRVWESSYQVRQILRFFCKVVTLILGQNCVKGLIVMKVVK